MKYYKNTNNEIFGIEQGQEILVQSDWIEISLDEIAELQKPTQEQLNEQQVQEAKNYLSSTDWIVVKIQETQIKGGDITGLLEQYSAEFQKRDEARLLINEMGGN